MESLVYFRNTLYRPNLCSCLLRGKAGGIQGEIWDFEVSTALSTEIIVLRVVGTSSLIGSLV
jgi:hypothetical protein